MKKKFFTFLTHQNLERKFLKEFNVGFDVDGIIALNNATIYKEISYSEARTNGDKIRMLKKFYRKSEPNFEIINYIKNFLIKDSKFMSESLSYDDGKEKNLNILPIYMPNDQISDQPNQFKICLITGRYSIYRDVTVEWLIEYDVPFHKLFMNETNEHGNYMKEKIRNVKESGVKIYFDDDPEVVDAINLKCDCVAFLYKK